MLGLAGVDGPAEALPMGASKSFRNDHIQTLAKNFARGVAEDSLGPLVPYPDRSVAVGEDDGIGSLLHDFPKRVQFCTLELAGRLHSSLPWKNEVRLRSLRSACRA